MSSHKRTEDSLQILLSGIRDRLALGRCQEQGLDIFCLAWESQIHRHPPPPFKLYKLLESKSSYLGLLDKVFRQKDHRCHGKMDAFHLQSTRQHILKQLGSQKQQPSVINDKVIALARSTLRTQISFHLEKQSGFLDT